ncbi:MAG: preprotein translocase subunit SecE [Clostridia bacterium]|nr:preprotein translocase subunit SecE [Clostridia bacterium]
MAEQAVVKKKGFARIAEYFKGVSAELKKVAWPTKKETYKYTLVVLVVCAAFALLFWVLDTIFLALLGLII